MPCSPESRPATDRSAQGSVTIPELDSLRGVAIALVMLVHAEGVVNFGHPYAVNASPPFLRSLIVAGHTGVSLFFVLSAFLLARPFLAEIAGGPTVDRGRYFLRRFWRIMPLYALAVAITTFVVARQPADLLRGLPYLCLLNFTVTAETRIAPLVSGVWWSLSTEWQFYLLLPLLPLALRSRRSRWIAALIGLAYVAAYVAFVQRHLSLGSRLTDFTLQHTIFGRAPVFLWGIAAAFVYERWGRRIRAWATRTRWVYAWGADVTFFVLVLALLAGFGSLMAAYDYVALESTHPAWHVVEGAVWALVLLFCLLAPLRARALMRGGRLAALGTVSYSVYLLHAPLLLGGFYLLRICWPGLFNEWNVATIAAAAVIAAVTIALARVSYWNIEEPLMWREAEVPAPAPTADGVPRVVAAGRRPSAARGPAAAWGIPIAAN